MNLHVEITGTAPKSVFVIGVSPIGVLGKLKAPPYDFSAAMPKDIDSGPYLITATAQNDTFVDAEVTIDIERSESPRELRTANYSNRLHVKETRYLTLTGIFPDGSMSSLQNSTLTSVTSSNSSVVAVVS